MKNSPQDSLCQKDTFLFESTLRKSLLETVKTKFTCDSYVQPSK